MMPTATRPSTTKALFGAHARWAVRRRAEYHARRLVPGDKYIYTLAAAPCAAVVVYGGVDMDGDGGLEESDMVGITGMKNLSKSA